MPFWIMYSNKLLQSKNAIYGRLVKPFVLVRLQSNKSILNKDEFKKKIEEGPDFKDFLSIGSPDQLEDFKKKYTEQTVDRKSIETKSARNLKQALIESINYHRPDLPINPGMINITHSSNSFASSN